MLGGVLIGLGSYAAVNTAAYFTLGKPLNKAMEKGNTFVKILTAVLAGPATLMNKIYPASKIKEKRAERKAEKKLAIERENEARRARLDQYKRGAGTYDFLNDYRREFNNTKATAKNIQNGLFGMVENMTKAYTQIEKAQKVLESSVRKYSAPSAKNSSRDSIEDIYFDK